MKLTFFGKVIFGAGALVFALVIYMMVLKPKDTGPDFTRSAQLSFDPRRIASDGAAEAAYRARATKAVSYCNFFSGYRLNRGKPISFDAYIPGNYTESLYYYEDPTTGEQYIPAYFIAPGGSGLQLARAFAQESFERLPGCAPTPEQGGSGGIVMLGFPKGRLPQGQYVRVFGELWWDSINLNPSQIETEEGAETAPAPVVKIATFDRLTTSQASDPANETFPMDIAIQRGPGIIRVSRLEFADNETRVWVELVNLTSKALTPWVGSSRACIRPAGDACIVAGTTTESDDLSVDAGENQIANDDTLDPESPIPPAASGSTLSGYLTFSRLDPGQELQLELPDFSEDGDDETVAAPITVRLPNEKTATAAETSSGDARLAGSNSG